MPRETPFLGELLLWCYLHTSVPSHILKEQGKALLIQQETLGATKITVLDVDHTTHQWIRTRTTDALFLVNCWCSYFMHFSSINVSDIKWYKDVNINFLFVRSNMSHWEITFTPQKIGRKHKKISWWNFFSMDFGSLGTTPSPSWTPMLLEWGYLSEIMSFMWLGWGIMADGTISGVLI
jgi:hypothetical protein